MIAVVFLAFSVSSVFFMKQIAVAQAAGVLIDATIVRALLVPSLMRLLGEWNWWAPGPLEALPGSASGSASSQTPAATREGSAAAIFSTSSKTFRKPRLVNAAARAPIGCPMTGTVKSNVEVQTI